MALLASSVVLEGFGVAPPAPTVGPPLLGARQATMETCAWYSLTSSSSEWDALMCEEPCTTSDGKFGCSYIPQTCQDHTDPVCSGSVTVNSEITCCAADYPFCVTGFLTTGGDTLTAFRCGRGELSGEATLYASAEITDTLTTTVVTTEEDDKIKTVTRVVGATTPSADPDDKDNADGGDASNPGADEDKNKNNNNNNNDGDSNNNNDNNKDDGNSDGGGGAPIGAIVGGAIGGVALILLIAFAIWFIRFQKKKSAASAAAAAAGGSTPGVEPYRQPEYIGGQPAYTGSPPQGYQSGYYAPSTQQEYKPQGWTGASSGYAPTTGSSPAPGQPMAQAPQMAPVEMPAYSGFGAPQELPAQGR